MFSRHILDEEKREEVNRGQDPHLHPESAYARFHWRRKWFQRWRASNDNRVDDHPKLVHDFWWIVHNCVAHPLIGVLPIKPTFDFHDWTSDKIMGK